jgi:Bacterial capsule synthesis protein PGA_cap
VRARRIVLAGLLTLVAQSAVTACHGSTRSTSPQEPASSAPAPDQHDDPGSSGSTGPTGVVTLAFAGDVHFQLHLSALIRHPRAALRGPVAQALASADLSMVNLETAITHRGVPEPKELEARGQRYYFRTSPSALDFLAASGVDVVSMGNNHAVDYGRVGLEDTLRAIRNGPIPVLGIGRNRRAALAPYQVSVRGTDIAFLAADASFREGASPLWAAGETTPGLAAARTARPTALLDAVAAASRRTDVVVVYLHWGTEYRPCPTRKQQTTAQALAEAGADVVVGSHAHVLLGSGWSGDTYVNYGLGNFIWYHDREPDSGVLRLRIRGGEVVGDSWTPALIQTLGRLRPLSGKPRAEAVAGWNRLRGCADLDSQPSS